MKRFLKITALALTFVMLACTASALPNAKSNLTVRVPLAEFTQLFVSRMFEFQDLLSREFDMDLNSSPAINIDGKLLINTAAGPAYINEDDLTVSSVSSRYLSYDDLSTIDNDLASCILMLSALEYDALQDDLLPITGSSPVYEAYMTFSDDISPLINDAAGKAKAELTPVKVYSGNYDYYIVYNEVELEGETRKWISLEAKARE